MGIFSCDKERCERRPYREIIRPSTDDEEGSWCYVCFWHYIVARIKTIFHRNEYGYCKVNTDREAIEYMIHELFHLQCDIFEIKEKLGIKEEGLDEFERNMDVT